MFRSFPTAWAMLFCFFLRWWPTLCTWLSCQARVLLTGEAGSWARLSRHRSPWLLLLSQVSFRLLRGPGICMRTELGVCRLSMGHLFDRAIYLHPNPTASLKAQQFSTDLKKNGINQMPWWKAADFGDPDTVVTVVTVVTVIALHCHCVAIGFCKCNGAVSATYVWALDLRGFLSLLWLVHLRLSPSYLLLLALDVSTKIWLGL